MKKIAILALLAIVGCRPDDSPVEVTGNVSFAVSGSVPETGKTIPQKLVLSVEDANGKTIFDNKVVDLTQKGSDFSTDAFQLENGDYRVTKYLVISGTDAVYATPKAGAQKASLVESPLPFDFTVIAGRSGVVAPKIVAISSQDIPQYFGYGDFGYDTPGSETQEWFTIRVKLDITVGDIFYPNIDAIYTVHAFDQSNSEVWTQDYTYIGPETNDLKIKNGFDHYTIEAKKWGQTLRQVYTRSSLYERRVREGEVAVVQVFQAKIQPKRVGSTVSSWTRVVDGQAITEPSSKTEYQYSNDRITGMKTYLWSLQENIFVDQMRSEFFYQGDALQKIVTYSATDQSGYVEDNYTYDVNGNVTHIQHKPSAGGVTVDVDFTYFDDGRSVKAVYRFSNGGAFEYELVKQFGSNAADKTTRSGELCSSGTYGYDKNVNPLAHLGYVDYLFRNYSISNRTTENVDYVGCAFPSLVAEAYSYVYDADEYPVKQETSYKGTGMKMVMEYEYVD